jgi:hypothetical protein
VRAGVTAAAESTSATAATTVVAGINGHVSSRRQGLGHARYGRWTTASTATAATATCTSTASSRRTAQRRKRLDALVPAYRLDAGDIPVVGDIECANDTGPV